MVRVRTFRGYVVNPARAPDIVAPAYDSMSPAERARYAESNPDNYLNVMRTREDYPQDARVSIGEILASNKRNLERLLARDGFIEQDDAAFYVYRLSDGGHAQTGLVAEIPVAEIDAGKVLKHEQTRRDREDLLVEYQEVVGASSSPVALAYAAVEEIRALLREIARDAAPHLDLESDDGARHTLWRVEDETLQRRLCELFERVPVTYLTDGHHRTASTLRYVARLVAEGRARARDGAWNHLLVALFPHDEMRVLPFHRCVRDLGMSREAFLDRLSERFEVEVLDCDPAAPALPSGRGEFTLVLDDDCFRVAAKRVRSEREDPAASLDAGILQDCVLESILGIADCSDPRVEYVSALSGVEGVNHLRARGWRVAFYCHPPSIEDIMAVSDAGGIMPPKSTCFDPKVRSGLFLRLN